MIVNFYKQLSNQSIKEAALLCSKNIESIPEIGMFIKFSGQYFKVIKIIFNIDTIEYDIYTKRYGN